MSDSLLWPTPQNHPALGEGELHIWQASLDVGEQHLDRLRATLNNEELVRAERFHFARDRDHFTASRGILRGLLGGYLDVSSASVEFEYGAYGKPSVRSTASRAPVQFNASHSDGVCLLAFSRDRELGIDVEAVRPELAGEEIAERYFSAQELVELRSLAAEIRTQAFFLCWTRKEAYMKARGLGLQIPLDSFSVSLTPGAPAVLASADSDRWNLRSFEPWPSFAAAVVEEGAVSPASFWSWKTR